MFSKLNEWHADASKKVNEAGDWVRDRITDVSSFHSDAFQFVSMLISDKEDAVDTMHYFCLPDSTSQAPFVIHTQRVVPAGVKSNELPKRRIFHVPVGTSMKEVVDSAKAMDRDLVKGTGSWRKDAGESLNSLANGIDDVGKILSGGTLLVGALVVIFNPIAGLILMGKSLLPSLGVDVANAGARTLSFSLEESAEQSVTKEVENTYEALEPEWVESALLLDLNRTMFGNDVEFTAQTYPEQEIMRLGPVLEQVYGELLTKRGDLPKEATRFINQVIAESRAA